jgi:hypothetical protein
VQVVGYDTGVGDDEREPALLLGDDGEMRRESLTAGTELAYSLGERHCAGVLTEDGHDPCENPTAPYCPDHTSTWACARCTGDCSKPLPSCDEEHAVYLAAFAPDVFKVGVTRSWRLDTRLREQGADRAAHLRTVADGRIARQIEADIARDIVDRVRVPTKVAGLHRGVDAGAWDALLSEYDAIDTYDFDYGLDLREAPVAETLATGTVRGLQGRVLVLDHAGSTYAVDLRDLVGHDLTAERTDRHLQSSLGAF